MHARRRGFATHTSAVLDFGVAQGRDAIHGLFAGLLACRRKPMQPTGGPHSIARSTSGVIGAGDEPFAADLLAVPQRDPAMYEAMDNATRTDGRLRALATSCTPPGGQRPLVLIVEDMHWATPACSPAVRALIDVARRRRCSSCARRAAKATRSRAPPLDVAVDTCDLPPLATRDALALARSYLTANPERRRGMR